MYTITVVLVAASALTHVAAQSFDVTQFNNYYDYHYKVKQYCKMQNFNYNCLGACIYKGMKMINDKGMLDPQGATNYFRGKANAEFNTALDEVASVASQCLYINDAAVTDGSAGCQRASLLAGCIAAIVEKQNRELEKPRSGQPSEESDNESY